MNTNDYAATADYIVEVGIENNILQTTKETINIDSDLVEQGLIDSMGVVLLQCMIEEEFGLEVTTEQLVADLRSIRRLAQYVEQKSQLNLKEIA